MAGSRSARTGSISTAITARACGRSASVRLPRPGPDLQHHVVVGQPGRAHDPPHGVRVGDEVLAQSLGRPDAQLRGQRPDVAAAEEAVVRGVHHQVPKARWALANSRSHIAASSVPRSAAMNRTVWGIRYEAFGLPRCGHGREVRSVGLDEDELVRHDGERRAEPVVGLVGDRSREGHEPAALGAVGRHRGIAAEAVEHHAIRSPLRLEHGEDVVVRVAVVDDEGLVELAGEVDVPAEGALLRRVQLVAGAEVVQARLADRADDVIARQHGDLRQGLVEGGVAVPLDDAGGVVRVDGHARRRRPVACAPSRRSGARSRRRSRSARPW